MPCYCARIQTLSAELENVNSAVECLDTASQREGDEVQSALRTLSSSAGAAYTPDNLGSLCATIGAFSDSVASGISGALSACQRKATELAGTISGLEADDRAYHEEQRRLQEAARARARARERASAADSAGNTAASAGSSYGGNRNERL